MLGSHTSIKQPNQIQADICKARACPTVQLQPQNYLRNWQKGGNHGIQGACGVEKQILTPLHVHQSPAASSLASILNFPRQTKPQEAKKDNKNIIKG